RAVRRAAAPLHPCAARLHAAAGQAERLADPDPRHAAGAVRAARRLLVPGPVRLPAAALRARGPRAPAGRPQSRRPPARRRDRGAAAQGARARSHGGGRVMISPATSEAAAPPPGGAEPLLSVRDLVKEFPVRHSGGPIRGRDVVHAVSGVSFDLYAGEVLSLV